jgi:hypothetical protein
LAKTSVPTRDSKPSTNNAALHPQAKDPRHELFYLLGVLRGAGVENSIRIAELVNQLLVPEATDGDVVTQ